MNQFQRNKLINLIRDHAYYAQMVFSNGSTEISIKNRDDAFNRITAILDAEVEEQPEKSDWPQLSPMHLQALLFAFNEGYSKAYDGREFQNPFSESGSQAAAWARGKQEGAEAREQDRHLYIERAKYPIQVNKVIGEVFDSMGGIENFCATWGYQTFAHALLDTLNIPYYREGMQMYALTQAMKEE